MSVVKHIDFQKESPYKLLKMYEKQLVDNNINIRALARICNSDQHKLVNKLEGITNKSWFMVSNTSDVDNIPDNYFDIVLVSDCDLKSELQQLKSIYPKLRVGGRIYFDNLLESFGELVDACLLSKHDLSINDNVTTLAYAESIRYILKSILDSAKIKYFVKIKKYNKKYYIVLVKKGVTFEVTSDLSKLLHKIDVKIKEILGPADIEPPEDDDTEPPEDDDTEPPEDDDTEPPEDEEYPEVDAPESYLPATLLPGLKNVGAFSCFMDSVLFTILLPNTGYFQDNILDKNFSKNNATCSYFADKTERLKYLKSIQTELRKLANIIRGNTVPDPTCTPIIQKLKKCNSITESLMSGNQQDDSEFLIGLAQIFDLNPTTVTISRSVSEDKKKWIQTSVSTTQETVLEIQSDLPVVKPVDWYQRVVTHDYNNVPMKEWPLGPNGQPYRYSREKHTIIESQALIFHVARSQAKILNGVQYYHKNSQTAQFSEYIKQNPDKHYALQAITIHEGTAQGGHYTAYFKYQSQWYHYNDILDSTRVRPVTWDEVVATGSKNGSLYIYYPIEQA